MTGPELIQKIEASGGVLALKGDRIRYELPEDAAPLVEVLREHREEVLRVLREREQPARCTNQTSPPPMPEGVKLLCWDMKRPPVAIETWAIVNDVPLFVRTTVRQLECALKGDCLGAGNWPVRTLVERLECVGVKVEVTT